MNTKKTTWRFWLSLVILLVLVPLIIVYLLCQRYLIEGIERSGIVG